MSIVCVAVSVSVCSVLQYTLACLCVGVLYNILAVFRLFCVAVFDCVYSCLISYILI